MAKWFRPRSLGVLAVLLGFLGIGLSGCFSQPPVPSTASPIRAAFYYGWFGGPHGAGWSQQGLDPFTKYHPTDGFYDSRNLSEVQHQIAGMQYAGIQVGISSWWGQGTFTDKSFPTQLQAAGNTNFRWTIYYEPEGQTPQSLTQIESDLNYLKFVYANDPSYLHLNGKPVAFVYNAKATDCSVADKYRQAATDTGFYIDLKVFHNYTTCASQPDSWHQYAPSSAVDHQGNFSIAISPGFNKANEAAPRLGRDLARWKQNVTEAKNSAARWDLVTTFNEWGEGSSVESAQEWTSPSGWGTYLDALHDAFNPDGSPPTTSPPTTGPPPTTTPTTQPPSGGGVCNNAGGHPATYSHVVVFSFENRTWGGVGGTNFGSVPYFNSLFRAGCTTFSRYTEPDTGQNSATQYVGTDAASTANSVRDDCSPGPGCQSTQDNIFRQVRNAGKTARSYVEGATNTCSAGGNAAKHVGALYFFGGNDHSFCNTEVVPYSRFDVNNLPSFAFVTPTLCNDGHDCSNGTVSNWASTNVGRVLNSAEYKAGHVLVQIWYDEDVPVPNMFIAPTAHPGPNGTAVNYASTMKLWESALGLPVNIGSAPGAADIRGPANV